MKKSVGRFVKIALISFIAFFAFSRATSKPLYSWYDYQKDYYNYIKKADNKSLDELIKTYEKIIEKQKATRGTVPPGVYADYGYILMKKGKTAEAKAMFAKEVELYPESEVFVGSILKRLAK